MNTNIQLVNSPSRQIRSLQSTQRPSSSPPEGQSPGRIMHSNKKHFQIEDEVLPSTSRNLITQEQLPNPTDYSAYRIHPYDPKYIPKSQPHSLIIPWCKKLGQYVLPPKLPMPTNLDPHLQQNTDIHSLLLVCRSLDEDVVLRNARLPPQNSRYCSILFAMVMSVIFLAGAGALGMYLFLTKDNLFLYSAIGCGGLFLLGLILRFPILSCKKSSYKTYRRKQYQKVADKINREVFRARGIRVNVGRNGDWLEFTNQFKTKLNSKKLPGKHHKRTDSSKKLLKEERGSPGRSNDSQENVRGVVINPRNNQEQAGFDDGMAPTPRMRDIELDDNIQYDQEGTFVSPRNNQQPEFYSPYSNPQIKQSPTFYKGSTEAKTQEHAMSPMNPQNIQFQSYQSGLPPINGHIDYDEIRLSRISQLKKPDLKPFNAHNLNSIDEEDNSGDYEYNARFSSTRNPEYFYSYRDRIVDLKTNESIIVSSPGKTRQLEHYRASENIDPNMPHMNDSHIRRPPPTSPNRGNSYVQKVQKIKKRRKNHPVVYMVNNAHSRNRNQGQRTEVQNFQGNLGMRQKMINGKVMGYR